MQYEGVRVADEIRQRHPAISVMIRRFENLKLAATNVHVPTLEATQNALAAEVDADADLSSHSTIAAWRRAIGLCGLKPSRTRSSIEALARRVRRGQPIRTPLPLVDLYCALSVIHMTPLGAYDIDRLPTGPIELRLANPEDDHFQPLGAGSEDLPLDPAIAVYAIGDTVLCYAYNHRDSRETSLTLQTDHAIFIGEALDAAQAERLEAAMSHLEALLLDAGAVLAQNE